MVFEKKNTPFQNFPERNEIKEQYHDAILAATDMRIWIHIHIGPARELLFAFFRPFCNLYELTCDLEPVTERLDRGDLRKNAEAWFAKVPDLNNKSGIIEYMKTGLMLFRNYKRILVDAKILKIDFKN